MVWDETRAVCGLLRIGLLLDNNLSKLSVITGPPVRFLVITGPPVRLIFRALPLKNTLKLMNTYLE